MLRQLIALALVRVGRISSNNKVLINAGLLNSHDLKHCPCNAQVGTSAIWDLA